MRVIHRAAATAVVAALALVLVACDPAPTEPLARDRAAAWLVQQFGADNLIAASFDPSLDDLGGSAYSASNLMASGTGRDQARAAVDGAGRYASTSTPSTPTVTTSRGRWPG